MRRKGFTLIELLVVIAIIAILAAILFPVFAQAREKARQTQCVSNMRQSTTAARMYMEDFDQQSMYWLWYNRNNTGVWISWMEMLNPYVKNNDVFLCPSMSKNISSYTTGCTSAPAKVVSNIVWVGWVPYNYWDWFGLAIMFAGFPSPCRDAALCPNNVTYCANAWAKCTSAEFAENPAESTFFIEGYFISYFPVAGTTFGSSCTTGFHYDENNTNFHRHNKGMNLGFVDGHAKWVAAANFHRNNGSRTTGQYANYPQSPFMRFGQ